MALFCPFLAQKRRFLALISALNALEDYGLMQHDWFLLLIALCAKTDKFPAKSGEPAKSMVSEWLARDWRMLPLDFFRSDELVLPTLSTMRLWKGWGTLNGGRTRKKQACATRRTGQLRD
jgi:hypothetical protein